MTEFNRYTKIRELVFASLEEKTNWKKDEIKVILNDLLMKVADEEISYLEELALLKDIVSTNDITIEALDKIINSSLVTSTVIHPRA